jgi:mono/diheme cytochrome c family protein
MSFARRAWWTTLVLGGLLWTDVAAGAADADPAALYRRKNSWVETVLETRRALASAPLSGEARAQAASDLWALLRDDFPVEWDWVAQDFGLGKGHALLGADALGAERRLVEQVTRSEQAVAPAPQRDLNGLAQSSQATNPTASITAYALACEQRRAQRLTRVTQEAPRLVFTRHRTIRPSFFAYTEGQSDAQNERHFLPGSSLCLLETDAARPRLRTLVEDPGGAIRDPAVSYDGTRVCFAWKKSLREDDYHLYELEVTSGRIRQLTFGLGFADYEPAYLPNGDIIFSSTRCVQTVDCWWTEVSNLYTCDRDGRHLRRLGFDQVHTVFPSVTGDGRVIYTRWDYNDRGQIFPQALFQMNPDGTGQTEFYGNNSWFPTTLAHARGIPGTQKVLAILCGHHSSQAGKLAVIDPGRGRQENSGVQLTAPLRETRAERIDSYGQEGDLFQYPWPLSENEYLVTYAPEGWVHQGRQRRREGDAAFGIYWMDMQGRRELLASHPTLACQHAVPLAPRPAPAARPSLVDYRKTTGTYYVQDVHAGPGLVGVPRGVIRKLRVVALEFRPAGVGNNGSSGPGGGALISTPVAIGNGTWDVKVVLGDATVHADGSAFFTVPARMPLYFQALDEKGRAVQTMRSWSTLQPGENQSCVGCHEHKNTAPPVRDGGSLALAAGPQALEPFHGPPRGFSFRKEIQPILDRHCVTCHSDRSQRLAGGRMQRSLLGERDPVVVPASVGLPAARAPTPPRWETTNKPSFSLLGAETVDKLAKRRWSDAYLNLTQARPANNDWDRGAFAGQTDGRVVNWAGSQSIPTPLPPYAAGSTRSELIPMLEGGHGGVRLSKDEMEKIACWIDLYVPYCGDYVEANSWNREEMEKYQRYADKRRLMEEMERRNVEALTAQASSGRRPTPSAAP